MKYVISTYYKWNIRWDDEILALLEGLKRQSPLFTISDKNKLDLVQKNCLNWFLYWLFLQTARCKSLRCEISTELSVNQYFSRLIARFNHASLHTTAAIIKAIAPHHHHTSPPNYPSQRTSMTSLLSFCNVALPFAADKSEFKEHSHSDTSNEVSQSFKL